MRRVVPGPVLIVALLHLGLLLAVGGRYGFHRDELYFLEAGRHLAWGYVDQPPLVPVLARVQQELFGASVVAIRVVPALVSAVSVVLAGVLARELGGSRRAQVIAAAALAGAGFVLGVGHLLSTATVDFMFWLALLTVVARLLRTGDARWWVPFGGLAGLALWNKHLVVLLAVAVLVALAIERRWDLLRWPWLLAGAGVAVLIALPTLVWQATNGWPQLEMAQALADRLAVENRATTVPLQLVMLGPLVLPLAVVGIRWLTRGPGRAFRPLLWAYGVALLLTLLTAGRPYYPLPLAAAVVVAGVVAVEHRWPRQAVALVAANAVLAVPLGLPVLPLGVFADNPLAEVNEALAETVGWPELVDTVERVVDDLPSAERDRVVLLTGSYGEAGALDRYGPGRGLPQVYSGHNSYWHWRRPSDQGATVVVVRAGREYLAPHFETCELAATIDNGLGVDNEAQGQPVWVCRGLRGSWEQRWPAFRHYS